MNSYIFFPPSIYDCLLSSSIVREIRPSNQCPLSPIATVNFLFVIEFTYSGSNMILESNITPSAENKLNPLTMLSRRHCSDVPWDPFWCRWLQLTAEKTPRPSLIGCCLTTTKVAVNGFGFRQYYVRCPKAWSEWPRLMWKCYSISSAVQITCWIHKFVPSISLDIQGFIVRWWVTEQSVHKIVN